MSMHHITTREKVVVMLAVMSALFLVALDQTIIATALGAIVNEFNSYSSIGFIVTAYMLTTTITVPLAGKLSDMYGRRPVLLSGVVIFVLGSLLSGLASNIELLIAWRALQGIGGGIIMANAFTIVGDLFVPRERGKWQGIIGAVFGMSSVIGPLAGGWLTDGQAILGATTDWRWTFLINVPIGIIATAIIARYLPNITHDAKHKPDYTGAVFITTALAALVLAVDNTDVIFKWLIDDGVALETIKTVLFSIAAVSAVVFALVERKASQPILPLRFFKNRTYSLMVFAFLLFGAAFMGGILYLTQFNQQVFGATASQAGLMLLPMVAGMMVSSISAGQLASRTGRYKPIMVAGFLIAAVAMLSLTALQPDTPYAQEAWRMALLGLGLGLVMPLLNLAVQNEFEQRDLGAATSSMQLFRGLGSTIGTAVLSGVLTAGITNSFGNPMDMAYIQTLKNSPEASKILEGEVDSDTLLAINAQRGVIKDGFEKGVVASPAPAPVKKAQASAFEGMQQDFSDKVIKAFSDSLRLIFVISGSLIAVAFVAVLFVRERKLRSTVHHDTSGET